MEILTDNLFRTTLGILLGAIVGSFLNVCATRIPKGLSIVSPRSRCPGCNKKINWFNNLPVISWLLLQGRASCCEFKIPFRYFLVELFTALVFGFMFLELDDFRNWGLLLSGMFFVSFLIVIIAVDYETMSIPDRFSIGGALLGIFFSFSFPSLYGFSTEPIFFERMSAVFSGIIGLLVSSAILFWIGAIGEGLMRKEALGQGDVKMLGFVGAFCGWQGGLFVIFGGAVIGTTLLLPVIIYKKFSVGEISSNNKDRLDWGMEIPFGPFLGIAALFYFLGFRDFVDVWFDGIISNFMHIFSIL